MLSMSVQQGWRARADLKGSSMAICQAKQGTCKVQQNTERALQHAEYRYTCLKSIHTYIHNHKKERLKRNEIIRSCWRNFHDFHFLCNILPIDKPHTVRVRWVPNKYWRGAATSHTTSHLFKFTLWSRSGLLLPRHSMHLEKTAIYWDLTLVRTRNYYCIQHASTVP
jgi:hypothetical protein